MTATIISLQAEREKRDLKIEAQKLQRDSAQSRSEVVYSSYMAEKHMRRFHHPADAEM